MAHAGEFDVGARSAVEAAFRRDHGRVMAVLTRDLGSFDLAEDALQDAFIEALRVWPSRGAPRRPAAWIITTARNRGIDRLRRLARGAEKLRQLSPTVEELGDEPLQAILEDEDIPDERLRLFFTCCHPALARSDAVALTLRSVGGLSAGEIAAAFLVKETTMQARLTRAKAKIRDAGIPYRVPDHHELPERLPAVLDTVSLIYNQGYTPAGAFPVVDALRHQALAMAGVLAAHLPDEPEALGCHALLMLHEARSPSRVDDHGDLVTLEHQDRSRWDRDRIADGERLLERALRLGRPGPFQIQAAISALHCTAESAAETDWPQIAMLYDELLAVAPSPTNRIGRAVAIGMAFGPDTGLAALPPPDAPLDRHHRWHAAKADLLGRSGRSDEAAEVFATAAELAVNPAERRWLLGQQQRFRQAGG